MKTTKFAFQRNGFIQIIEKAGKISSFNEQLHPQLSNHRFYPDGRLESCRDHNGGKWTIIDEISDYSQLSEKISENMLRVEALEKEAAEKKAVQDAIVAEKASIVHAEYMNELYSSPKGWYVVSFSVLVSVLKGNDGWRDYSWKVLAENGVDAYEKATSAFSKKLPKNVSFIYHFAEITSASTMIDYIGVWTDEAELDYPRK